MSKQILIASCTRSVSVEECSKLPIVQSFNANLTDECRLNLVRNNKNSLPIEYNRILKETDSVEWIVFVHDDVYLDDKNLANKLNQARVLGYDIVGLAGCNKPQIKQHNLWHHMADRTALHGAVQHPCNATQTMTTNFGPVPSRVAIIDGLFMAVHVPSVAKTGWKFNENYDFHHYDIASSLDANKHKLRIGVMPIYVIHSSPGLLSIQDKRWADSNQKFLEEYGNAKQN